MSALITPIRQRPRMGRPATTKNLIVGFLEWFGELGIFFWQVVRAAVTPPFEFRELYRQLDEIGSKSLPVVALAGGAIGVILSLEARQSLTRFGAKSMLPAAVVFAIMDESGPIITALVASGRLGAGIGAELASMKVTEQIDAIEASAVNPLPAAGGAPHPGLHPHAALADPGRRLLRLGYGLGDADFG
jgi:ABC-type transporter Mla maintaining outer membrane lipid asymmetry permease subunit MlaE